MATSKHLFPYEWRLSDGYPAKGIENNGCKVFGTFICGGGSSMGYKLAGFDHIGGVELDPNVAAVYKQNHHPKYLYVEDIRDFNNREDLPDELYQLDILDGSPPCSTFSMVGSREKAWGKEKKFAEGQKTQRLDDLVFVYCDTIAKLKPKVCWLENVAGLVRGNGKAYAKQIVQRLNDIGYNTQVFLLNAATMGVPQRRERVFFIGLHKDYRLPKLTLSFNEPPILFGEIEDESDNSRNFEANDRRLWLLREHGDKALSDVDKRIGGKGSYFSRVFALKHDVCPTIISGPQTLLFDKERYTNENELKKIGSFAMDYNCGKISTRWLVGMSVPPVMVAQISHQIWLQWLSKIQ